MAPNIDDSKCLRGWTAPAGPRQDASAARA